jgi:hypothetical protein
LVVSLPGSNRNPFDYVPRHALLPAIIEGGHHRAAGWGAAVSVCRILLKRREPIDGARVAFKMNHEDGGYDRP